MLYQRQNSRINLYVTMDEEKQTQVVPSCVYDTLDSEAITFSSGPATSGSFKSTDATSGPSMTVQTMAYNNQPCETDLLFDFGGATGSIAEAAKRALIDGNMTPLIKEELKYSIQNKRLKEGKHELKVEFTEPLPDLVNILLQFANVLLFLF